MVKAINSIWKNLLLDVIIGIMLVGLVGYNLLGRSGKHLDLTLTDKLAISAYYLLWTHFLILLVLSVINLIQKAYVKAIVFLLISIGLFVSLQFIGVFLFISSPT